MASGHRGPLRRRPDGDAASHLAWMAAGVANRPRGSTDPRTLRGIKAGVRIVAGGDAGDHRPALAPCDPARGLEDLARRDAHRGACARTRASCAARSADRLHGTTQSGALLVPSTLLVARTHADGD